MAGPGRLCYGRRVSTSLSPVRRALVSVSNKSNLSALASALIEHKVEVLSTGGTYKALIAEGVAAVKVSEFTGAPEILGGRVKTLHPKIHGGILALPTAEHESELKVQGIPPIDLVVVNLYPFRETIARPGCTFADAIENIDIGGPTMVRAAAKNWPRVCVIVEPSDYGALASAMAEHGGRVPEEFRRAMARKAFQHTAAYDAAIANYLARHDDAGVEAEPSSIAATLNLVGESLAPLRYGENPHQDARFFKTNLAASEPTGLDRAVHRNPGAKALSYNNLLDADAALGIARDLHPLGRAAAVFKHLSPCGAAVAVGDESLADVYERAREADAESAFGGIVSVTEQVDMALAERIAQTFIEVVVAPGFTEDAVAFLTDKKKNLRLLEVPEMFAAHDGPPPARVRSVAGGVLVQREDEVSVSASAGQVASKRAPTAGELVSLDLGQRVGKHVRSNAVVLVKDGVTVGVGGGQTSRVEAVRQAVARAGDEARGSVLASDAFFPFRDSIDALADAGVVAVIQPGGSKRDGEVIEAADEHGMAMVFTGQRHFRH
jgi:phosphoribosylaminoimidazolecarboxamide formyltransferase/IMP cyclohydrolase